MEEPWITTMVTRGKDLKRLTLHAPQRFSGRKQETDGLKTDTADLFISRSAKESLWGTSADTCTLTVDYL